VILRALLVTGVLLAVAGAWWWFVRCERVCAALDRDAQELFERGELLTALERIDRVDARCRCSRFTAGDAPPQYTLAQASLSRLLSAGRHNEVQQLLAQARGPILKEFATRIRG
jgi:hypothetical protein